MQCAISASASCERRGRGGRCLPPPSPRRRLLPTLLRRRRLAHTAGIASLQPMACLLGRGGLLGPASPLTGDRQAAEDSPNIELAVADDPQRIATEQAVFDALAHQVCVVLASAYLQGLLRCAVGHAGLAPDAERHSLCLPAGHRLYLQPRRSHGELRRGRAPHHPPEQQQRQQQRPQRQLGSRAVLRLCRPGRRQQQRQRGGSASLPRTVFPAEGGQRGRCAARRLGLAQLQGGLGGGSTEGEPSGADGGPQRPCRSRAPPDAAPAGGAPRGRDVQGLLRWVVAR